MARTRNPTLADALRTMPGRKLGASLPPTAGPASVAARHVGPSPKEGYQFIQKTGLRAGQHFNLVRGDSGLWERKYETGDTADSTSARQARRSPNAQRSQQGLAGALKRRRTFSSTG